MNTIKTADKSFIASFDRRATIQPGAVMPDFELPSATGEMVSSSDLLSRGPILLSFYRGGWCPFCNIELRALQKSSADFRAAGVTLVAISPESPDQSLERAQKMGLDYIVLSDTQNDLARKIGIISPQPESMRPVLESADPAWATRESLDVPVPASFLLEGQTGVVVRMLIDPNYRVRLEPKVALMWVEELKSRQTGNQPQDGPERHKRPDAASVTSQSTATTGRGSWNLGR